MTLTVAEYAKAKLLDPEKLAGYGVIDDTYLGGPAVQLAYWSSSVSKPEREEGRWRISLNGGNNFKWSPRTSAKRLYGWDRIDRGHPEVLLVEGESDCHSLWHAGSRHVLGIPGADCVPDSIAKQLEWAETVYVNDEQDGGSVHLIPTLTRLLGDKLRIVTCRPEAKDFSELWMKLEGDNQRFNHQVRGIVEAWRAPTDDERRPKKATKVPPRYQTGPANASEPGSDPDRPWGRPWGESDTDNAARFITLHGDKVRYLPTWDSWLVWAKNRWRLDLKNTLVHELAKDVPISMLDKVPEAPDPKDFARAAAKALARSAIANMVYLARGVEGIPLEHEELDKNPWLLGVANGVIDLKTGQLRDARPDDLMMMQAPTKYRPEAPSPRWDQALTEWFPDPALRSYVQRLTGSCLVGAQLDHVFAIHNGPGANGKGTLTRAVQRTLGAYAVTPHLSLLVDSRNEEHDTQKAYLFRARLAIATETERRVRLREAQIKNLTGGDRINARRMRENPWEFDPSHHLWLVTNHLPEITGRDIGIWRRIRVVPWTADFTTKPDRDLDLKLAAETPGILRWLVEGCLAWQTEGLNEPEIVVAATAKYREAEDVIARWIASTGLIFGPGLSVPATDLTGSWHSFCETHLGEKRRFNETANHLEQRGCYSKIRTWRDEDRKKRQETRWFGVGRPEDEEVVTPGDPSPGSFREDYGIQNKPEQGSTGVTRALNLEFSEPADLTGTAETHPGKADPCPTPEACAAYPFGPHLPVCPADTEEDKRIASFGGRP